MDGPTSCFADCGGRKGKTGVGVEDHADREVSTVPSGLEFCRFLCEVKRLYSQSDGHIFIFDTTTLSQDP